MKVSWWALLSTFLFVSAVLADTINFDRTPDGKKVRNNAVVNNLYKSLGITFVGVPGPGGATCLAPGTKVYASKDDPAGFGTHPNGVTLCVQSASDISENAFGSVEAEFPVEALSVCISVLPDRDTGTGFITSLDGSGAVISTTTSNPGVNQQICVSGGDIRAVQFSGSGANFARFDTLVFTLTPLAQPKTPKVTLQGNTAVVHMQKFKRGALYAVTFQRTGKSPLILHETVKANSLSRALKPGAWSVSYAVSLGAQHSPSSSAKSIIVH